MTNLPIAILLNLLLLAAVPAGIIWIMTRRG